MNNQLPIVVRCHMNETTVEVCHGEISDVCRLLKFDPVIESELPDTKEIYNEFQDWLSLYRRANLVVGQKLLEETLCQNLLI